MTKKRASINQEDLDAFHEAVKDIKPLKSDKILLPSRDKPTNPLPKHLRREKESLNLNETLDLDPVQSEEYISWKQAGISHKILRNLRKGQYNIEATLDLHGYIVEDARKEVDTFLEQCLHDRIRVVLIIHGKGHHSQMPILKNKLNHWLRDLPSVLAFCSAAPAHGSRGAIYILLKGRPNE